MCGCRKAFATVGWSGPKQRHDHRHRPRPINQIHHDHTSYTGVPLRHVYARLLSEATGLRGATGTIAVPGILLAILALPLLRLSRFSVPKAEQIATPVHV